MPEPSLPRRTATGLPRRGGARTPVGVWVVVGLGVFFVLAGFGIAAFIAVRALQSGHATPTVARAKGPDGAVPTPSPDAGAAAAPVLAAPAAVLSPPEAAEARADEREQTRRDVLQRVDLMRNFSQREKDELYAQVQRARSFSRLATLAFPNGRTGVEPPQGEELRRFLTNPAAKALLEDPTIVLVALGYADTAGDQTKNLEISRTRAEGVIKFLRERVGLTGVMHAIGMGGQDLFDKTNRDKNRVVELWAVSP